MTYEVGLGDSPQRIAGYLSGNHQRYGELLAANRHKQLVYVGGMPTFASLGVGERLNVPGGFVGDALCNAFGVGTHEEAFDALERTFGVGATPESAFDAIEQTFGTSRGTYWPSDLYGTFEYGLSDFGTGGDFDHLAPVKRRPVAVFTEETEAEVAKQQKERRPIVRGAKMAAWKKKYGKKKNIFEKIGGAVVDVVTAPVKAVTELGKAAGKGLKEIGKVTANVAKKVGEGLGAAAKFVADAGGDALKWVGEKAKDFAKDPLGALAKLATTGGLSLIGVDPQKALADLGIPTPDTMLKSLGLPTTSEITHTAFRSVTNPKVLLDQIPGVNELTKYIPDMPDPLQMAGNLVNAALSGDLDELKTQVLAIGHMVADVASMVPGIGNVIGGPLASAITLLETGSPLKAALSLLLGQIPGIPPLLRDILRVAFNAIADILVKGKAVTDILLAEFKKGVMEQAKKKGLTGPLADIVDSALNGAIQLIFKNKPLDKAALDIAKDGLEVARKKVGAGVPIPQELLEAEKTVKELEGVYNKLNEEHALTEAIVKLTKQDPQKKNPVTQKKIQDLRASAAGSKLVAQAHGTQAETAAKKEEGRQLTAIKKLPPQQQEQLRQLAAMKKLSPAKKEQLRQLAAMKKLPPEKQEQLRQLAALKKLSPAEQEEVRQIAAMKKLPPAKQEELRELAALKKLPPEQQQALAAMSPEERAELRELERAGDLSPEDAAELRKIAEKKAAAPPRAPQAEPAPPAPAPGPMPAPARAIGRVAYGPYPQAA